MATVRRRWAFDALNHLVLTSRLGRKPRSGGYIPIPNGRFLELLGNPIGPEVLYEAKRLEIIDCDDEAVVGVQCNGFLITKKALAYGITALRAPDRIANRLKESRRLRVELGVNPALRQLWGTLRKVRLGEGAWEALNTRLEGADMVSALHSIQSIDAIRRRHWRFCTDENTGRVFHNVANCPRVFRPHLTIGGDPTGEADIASSQPFFLAALAYKGEDTIEAKTFRGLASSERFYETFGEWIGLDETDHDNLKTRFFQEVLFGRKWFRAKMWEALEARFPRLAEFIDRVKRDDHCALARLLQQEEARVVIGQIAPILMARGIETLSIHDGLMARKEHLKEVQSIMTSTIERETGNRPLVRIK